jgi:hypothetical protein
MKQSVPAGMKKESTTKRKLFIAIFIVLILAASTLVWYYLEYGLKSSPPLVYDFNGASRVNLVTGQVSTSLLGWNAAGNVFVNLTDAVVIFPFGSISRQFQALSSTADVSFNWTSQSGPTEVMTMIIHRQLNGVYGTLSYNSSAEGSAAYVYKTAFDVDKATVFTVELTMNNYAMGFLYSVKLWNSAEAD